MRSQAYKELQTETKPVNIVMLLNMVFKDDKHSQELADSLSPYLKHESAVVRVKVAEILLKFTQGAKHLKVEARQTIVDSIEAFNPSGPSVDEHTKKYYLFKTIDLCQEYQIRSNFLIQKGLEYLEMLYALDTEKGHGYEIRYYRDELKKISRYISFCEDTTKLIPLLKRLSWLSEFSDAAVCALLHHATEEQLTAFDLIPALYNFKDYFMSFKDAIFMQHQVRKKLLSYSCRNEILWHPFSTGDQQFMQKPKWELGNFCYKDYSFGCLVPLMPQGPLEQQLAFLLDLTKEFPSDHEKDKVQFFTAILKEIQVYQEDVRRERTEQEKQWDEELLSPYA
jgi:hypothetical protein